MPTTNSKQRKQKRKDIVFLFRSMGLTEMDRHGHYHVHKMWSTTTLVRLKIQRVSWRLEWRYNKAGSQWRKITNNTFKSTTEEHLRRAYRALTQLPGVTVQDLESSCINFQSPGMGVKPVPVQQTEQNKTVKKADIIAKLESLGQTVDATNTVAQLKEQLKAAEAAATPAPAAAAPASGEQPVAPAPAATKQPHANGVTRPRAGTKTGRVWEIADYYSKETGIPATRKDVLAACANEQINPATATTQYGKWRRFNGLTTTRAAATTAPAPPAPAAPETAPPPAPVADAPPAAPAPPAPPAPPAAEEDYTE